MGEQACCQRFAGAETLQGRDRSGERLLSAQRPAAESKPAAVSILDWPDDRGNQNCQGNGSQGEEQARRPGPASLLL